MPYILQTHGLTKIVGGKTLVSQVNLHVQRGEIYGFLGPNGAGKTTVMKLITNLWKPTEGSVELFGETLTPSSYRVLERMGSVIEFPIFYEHLSGRENLAIHCEYMGYSRPGCVEEALEALELSKAAEKPVREYSLGMKQRLGLARAVMCRPELLILDEPANGLDPAGMKLVRDLLKRLSSEYGVTVMVSSHILSEIESIADTIGVIHHGVLLRELSMRAIVEQNLACIELRTPDVKRASWVLAEKMGAEHFRIGEDGQIRIYDGGITVRELSRTLALNDVDIASVGEKRETLEDYFLRLTEEVQTR